jgi:Phage head-tail joining protein
MARTTTTPDAGSYNYPSFIQAEAPYSDDGQGGNANAGQWITVRSPMIGLLSGKFGRGAHLTFKYGQNYPTADHYAVMRYSPDEAISAGMRLVVRGRYFRILGAIDEDFRHMETIMPCVEERAQGSI